MNLTRVGIFLELLERELAGHPDLHADLLAVIHYEPQILLPWLSVLDEAEAKLGDLQTVVQWITCPHVDLAGAPPASLVGETNGVERVRELLARYDPLPPLRQGQPL